MIFLPLGSNLQLHYMHRIKSTKKVVGCYGVNCVFNISRVTHCSIIMWPWIFSKSSQKKVLLHTGHLQKSAYVVFSQVGDFNIPAKSTPMTHNVKPHIHFSCCSNFGLKFLWHTVSRTCCHDKNRILRFSSTCLSWPSIMHTILYK